MKLNNLISLMTLSVTAVLLVGCSHSNTSPNSSSGYNSASNNNGGATPYSVQGSAGFQATRSINGGTATNGAHINALKAPANQTYYFDFASNQIHGSDMRALNIQANYLAAHPHAKIRLGGNTDNRGSREYNIGLGWRRDQAVAHYFEQRGVSRKQIQMVSYGKEHPMVQGNNAHAWSLNRRVNLTYKVTS